MERDSHPYLAGALIGLVGVFIWFAMTKPDCRPGSVAIIGLGAGWYCTPGIKAPLP